MTDEQNRIARDGDRIRVPMHMMDGAQTSILDVASAIATRPLSQDLTDGQLKREAIVSRMGHEAITSATDNQVDGMFDAMASAVTPGEVARAQAIRAQSNGWRA